MKCQMGNELSYNKKHRPAKGRALQVGNKKFRDVLWEQDMTQDISNFTLQIVDATVAGNDLDDLARQLMRELKEMEEVESVDLASEGNAPAGTKSVEAITTGAIILAVLPTFLPKIVDFVQAWSLRGQGRAIKFKGRISGQDIEFEGSGEDLQKILATLSAKKAKKSK